MTHSPLLCCPLCQLPLTQTSSGLACENRHSFDQARQGYFNLLPVQNKRSKNPGDDSAMVASRRRFLEKNHYAPLSDRINSLLVRHLIQDHPNQDNLTQDNPPQENPARIADCGCGEGYYTARLLERLPAGSDVIGVDISKDAIRQACRRSKDITWLVASSSRLPVCPQSLDAILCLFTPISSDGFLQALKPNGQLLIAAAGPDHLLELRQQIYSDVRRKEFNPAQRLEPHFELIEEDVVTYTLALDSNDEILDLLAMTPHYWRVDAQGRERLAALSTLKTSLQVTLQLFQVRP